MFGSKKTQNDNFNTFMDQSEEPKHSGARGSWWQCWSTKRKILVIGGALLLVVALAVGLGVGLSMAGGGGDDEDDGPQGPVVKTNNTIPTEIWKPSVGATWNYELLNVVDDTSAAAEVWDIDLFNNDQGVINDLKSKGKKVLCYFSAGSYENWREDKDDFQESDLGEPLDGWPGERWLDTKSENVRNIMKKRMDLAVQKQCHGVEPDNVDAYDNENGLDLSEDDATDYVTFLSDEAHARNLSVALKNAGILVPRVIEMFDYSVQEQCIQYENCDQFRPFIDANKPVFHVEYPKGDDTNTNSIIPDNKKTSICDDGSASGFSTIIKNINLDNFIESCPPNATYSGR